VVVLDSGLGVPSGTAWAGVVERVSKFGRVCRYDRPGLGLSEPGPPPRTAARMVAELRALLHAARVPGTHHRIAEERPDVVAAAIREVLRKAS
jgi:pimeloyl-ACP methyl ester carboxylesterase